MRSLRIRLLLVVSMALAPALGFQAWTGDDAAVAEVAQAKPPGLLLVGAGLGLAVTALLGGRLIVKEDFLFAFLKQARSSFFEKKKQKNFPRYPFRRAGRR